MAGACVLDFPDRPCRTLRAFSYGGRAGHSAKGRRRPSGVSICLATLCLLPCEAAAASTNVCVCDKREMSELRRNCRRRAPDHAQPMSSTDIARRPPPASPVGLTSSCLARRCSAFRSISRQVHWLSLTSIPSGRHFAAIQHRRLWGRHSAHASRGQGQPCSGRAGRPCRRLIGKEAKGKRGSGRWLGRPVAELPKPDLRDELLYHMTWEIRFEPTQQHTGLQAMDAAAALSMDHTDSVTDGSTRARRARPAHIRSETVAQALTL